MTQAPGMAAPTENYQRTPVIPDVSRGQPGYRADEDEGPGDAGAARPTPPADDFSSPARKEYLPAEDMARLFPGKSKEAFKLCPEPLRTFTSRTCYVFTNGDTAGRQVTNDKLYAAMGKFKGTRVGGAEDNGLEFGIFMNVFKRGGLVRYQFKPLAPGAVGYEGLICAGNAAQEKKADPEWDYCTYVREDRSRRTTP